MATQTQTMASGHAPPIQKVSRYQTRAEAAPISATSVHSTSHNESIRRSMSRYRNRSSKPDRPPIPSLPQPPASPTRGPQFHAESLAALTGGPSPGAEESIRSPSWKRAESHTRQGSRSNKAASPKKNIPLQSPCAVRPPSPTDMPLKSRPLSWESGGTARVTAKLPHSYPQLPKLAGLNPGSERTQQLQAQQVASREARLRKRRDVEARERIAAKQPDRYKPDDWHQEQANIEMRQFRDEHQTPNEGGRTMMTKKQSDALNRGGTIREKLGSFARNKPAELLGAGKIQHHPEASKYLEAQKTKEETATRSPDPATADGIPSHFGSTAWVDAPLKRPAVEQPIISRAEWVDAPVSRPKPASNELVVLPQYDAPVSAVNAGERHVLVKCNSSSVTLPVTPSTTPRDLIASAAKALSEPIDGGRSKLTEFFSQLGLERPLRNYEHVRDVINSWDSDRQNTFIIVDCPLDQNSDLEATGAPKKQPGETSLHMYHSQKPGSWEKRWITLKSDGQITIVKRQGHEASNICHLTDYDIYIPTSRQQRTRIKPPRKICFAIKSLQKSNMFLDGSNFVHFFSSSDKAVASEWYKAVQGWRSWYLVNRLGEGEQSTQGLIPSGRSGPRRSASQRRTSIDFSPHQLSSSQPVLDSSGGHRFPIHSSASRAAKSAEAFHARKTSSRDRAPPPSAFLNKVSKDHDSSTATMDYVRQPNVITGSPPDELEASTFASSGLLGRTYSQWQKAQREHEIRNGRSETTPRPIDPPPGSDGGGLNRRTSTKSAREPPESRPLIDLTPQYQEPPQHSKKGKGVAAAPGQRLVDAATGLEMAPGAIVTPSATAWRRPDGWSLPGSAGPPSATAAATAAQPKPSSPQGDHVPIDPPGLLGHKASTSSPRRRPTQGSRVTGHGVRTGDRNVIDKPLVDLQLKSQFADGSLLRKVEQDRGQSAG